MLCDIPPATLTGSTPSFPVRFKRYITRKLNIPPARLYKILNRLPNRKPASTIRSIEMANASLVPTQYSISTTTILVSPSFTPGIPK